MKHKEYEEMREQLEILSMVVADLDEENMHAIGVSGDLLGKIVHFKGVSSGIQNTAGEAIRTVEEIRLGETSFSDGYSRLTASVEKLQRETESIQDFDGGDDGIDIDAENNKHPQQKTDGTPIASTEIPIAPLSPEDAEEFDTQFGVCESLVEALQPDDRHVAGVISGLLGRIAALSTLDKSLAATVTEGAETAEGLSNGAVDFEIGSRRLIQVCAALKAATAAPGSERRASRDDRAESVVKEDILAYFLEQQQVALEDFESILLSLEKNDPEAPGSIKRYIHNVKGEAGVLGLQALSGFLHELETCLKETTISWNSAFMTNALLEVKDFLLEYCVRVAEGGSSEIEKEKVDTLLSPLKPTQRERERRPAAKKSAEKVVERQEFSLSETSSTSSEMMDFVTETHEYLQSAEAALLALEKDPRNKSQLNEAFRCFHNVKGITGFLKLKDINQLSHEAENLLDLAREGGIVFTGGCAAAAFGALDMLKDMVEQVSVALRGGVYKTPEGCNDVIIKLRGAVSGETSAAETPVARTPATAAAAPAKAPAAEARPDRQTAAPAAAAPPDKIIDPDGEMKSKARLDGMVKVGTSRLDHLIDTVGELVIANAMVTMEQEIRKTANQRLSRNVSQLNKITRELQELAMSMRMVSLKGVFQKMARIVRDLSLRSGTPVDLTISGEDTELDRNVVEEIGSPLVHMVRNAVDHGIESPEERKKRGKPERGHVALSASHEGGNVVIRISDDGQGLNKRKILDKAVSLGLVQPDADLSDQEIFSLIFHPGFSTAEKVTDVSGRGVGMDVVKKCIDTLRGRVEIESAPGKGTAFTIRLPLTLAIIDGMVVSVGDEKYIIPTISIIESVRPKKEQVQTVIGKGEILNLRGELVPLFRLHRLFKRTGAKENPVDALTVIVAGDGRKCALLVDNLLDQQQVVIKSLGRTFDHLDGISGGAIMGDGKVSLILDTTGLVRAAHAAGSH